MSTKSENENILQFNFKNNFDISIVRGNNRYLVFCFELNHDHDHKQQKLGGDCKVGSISLSTCLSPVSNCSQVNGMEECLRAASHLVQTRPLLGISSSVNTEDALKHSTLAQLLSVSSPPNISLLLCSRFNIKNKQKDEDGSGGSINKQKDEDGSGGNNVSILDVASAVISKLSQLSS